MARRRQPQQFAGSWAIDVLESRISTLETEQARLRGELQNATGRVRGWGQAEPAFDLADVADMVFTKPSTLTRWLCERRELFPARYRLDGKARRRHRVLYASEVRKIRALRWRGTV